jgi:hypothetical protein
MGGRSFATNVLQGAVVAVLGKPPEQIRPQEYMETLLRAGIKPRVEALNPVGAPGVVAGGAPDVVTGAAR